MSKQHIASDTDMLSEIQPLSDKQINDLTGKIFVLNAWVIIDGLYIPVSTNTFCFLETFQTFQTFQTMIEDIGIENFPIYTGRPILWKYKQKDNFLFCTQKAFVFMHKYINWYVISDSSKELFCVSEIGLYFNMLTIWDQISCMLLLNYFV